MLLSKPQKEFLVSIILKHVPDAQLKLFGSRANNTAKEFSDVDIAIITQDKLDLAKLTILKDEVAQSDFPYMVDLIDWHRVSDEFREHILKMSIEL